MDRGSLSSMSVADRGRKSGGSHPAHSQPSRLFPMSSTLKLYARAYPDLPLPRHHSSGPVAMPTAQRTPSHVHSGRLTPQLSGGALRCPARRMCIMKWRTCGAHATTYHRPLQLLVRRLGTTRFGTLFACADGVRLDKPTHMTPLHPWPPSLYMTTKSQRALTASLRSYATRVSSARNGRRRSAH